jgi:hypothetical protein
MILKNDARLPISPTLLSGQNEMPRIGPQPDGVRAPW